MKRNKNGFTLIELLAVIVVLAIIMVIATMQVNKTLLKSRTNAFISSAESVVNAAKKLQVESNLNTYNLRKSVDYSPSDYEIYVYEYEPVYICDLYTCEESDEGRKKLDKITLETKPSYKSPYDFLEEIKKTYGEVEQVKNYDRDKGYALKESEMTVGNKYYTCAGVYNYIASTNKTYNASSAMIMIEAKNNGKFNNVNFKIDGLNLKNNYNYDVWNTSDVKRKRICARIDDTGKVERADPYFLNNNVNMATMCYSAETKDDANHGVIK